HCWRLPPALHIGEQRSQRRRDLAETNQSQIKKHADAGVRLDDIDHPGYGQTADRGAQLHGAPLRLQVYKGCLITERNDGMPSAHGCSLEAPAGRGFTSSRRSLNLTSIGGPE